MSLQAPTRPDLRREVHNAARRARVAARALALLPTVAKDAALQSAADAIGAHTERILAANAEDLDAARSAGTPTAMLDRLTGTPDKRAAFYASVPLKRGAKPEEIADAIVFLASNKASFVTGQIIRINGGKTAA